MIAFLPKKMYMQLLGQKKSGPLGQLGDAYQGALQILPPPLTEARGEPILRLAPVTLGAGKLSSPARGQTPIALPLVVARLTPDPASLRKRP
jgi:hypothetical protein